jgi:hypothetical protein
MDNAQNDIHVFLLRSGYFLLKLYNAFPCRAVAAEILPERCKLHFDNYCCIFLISCYTIFYLYPIPRGEPMKTKVLFPFVVFALLVLAVGLACITTTATPAAQPTQQQIIPPTLPPQQPTQPPQPTLPPQPTATDETPAFFTEDFVVTSLPNWSYFLMSGDESNMSITSGDHLLSFDLEGANVWVYLMYDPYTYTDVRIDARAENRGKNNNNVSVICRYSNDGWYEFNIANNGLYWILAYDNADQSYYTIFNGGSTLIKMGKDTNDYTVGCVGNTLSLYINGTLVKSIKDTKYNFKEGQIGLGVSSFDVWPIIIDWDYITISQP